MHGEHQLTNIQILQVLVFCTPFYTFMDQVRQRTVHSMKSDTPLVDAMIMFMREFQVLASAESADVLRMLLNQQQLEQYGEAFTPEYVYDAIRKVDRFSSMRVSRWWETPIDDVLLISHSEDISRMLRSSLGSYWRGCTTSA